LDEIIASDGWEGPTPAMEAARLAIVAVLGVAVDPGPAEPGVVGFNVHIRRRCTAVSKLLMYVEYILIKAACDKKTFATALAVRVDSWPSGSASVRFVAFMRGAAATSNAG